MRWFVSGTITPAAIEALKRHGHSVEGVTPAAANRVEQLQQARSAQLDILTADSELVETIYAEDSPTLKRSVVYLQLAGGEVEQDDAIDRLFKRYKRLSPGRMYTVTETRVKVRQLPTQVRSSRNDE